MESIWMKENKIAMKKKEIHKKEYEVIVIGAGMAGLLTAYYLQKNGFDVLVLEANCVGSGQSGKTTAKITSQHGLKYTKMVKNVGFEKAFLYAQAQEEAIDEFEEVIKEENIDCDFKRVDSYLYSLKEEDCLWKEVETVKKMGISARFTKRSELPFCVKGALRFNNQAQMNPVLFMKGLIPYLTILENCRVTKIKGKTIYSTKGIFKADKIVIATHYPIKNVPGFYFMREHQEISYVMALSNVKPLKHMYYGIDEDGMSFRSYHNYLLLGKKGKRTGEEEEDNVYESMKQYALTYFPNAKIETFWSAQDCMPHDEIPFVGRYSIFLKDVYVISGFQKWGMSMSMVAAMIIRDLCMNKENPYTALFSPQRLHIKAGYKNLCKDLYKNTIGLWKGWLCSESEKVYFLGKEEAKIMEIQGKKCACYKDKEGEWHIIDAKCSHMGCELTWNENEKRWDCPCHGSSFDIDGKIIHEPAIKTVKNYKNTHTQE